MNSLVKFCPALPRLLYRPVQLAGGNLGVRISELLKKHGSVVITGPDQERFGGNTNIGKTDLVYRELIPLLQREGRSCCFTDLARLIDPEAFLFYSRVNTDRINQLIAEIPLDREVYIFDEIHLIFPAANYPRELRLPAASFWEKVEALASAGKQLVFITARHPLNPDFHETLLLPGMKSFLTAPVVELTA